MVGNISIHQVYNKYHISIRSCLPFLSFLRCRGVNSTTPVKHHPLPFNSPGTLAALIELSETPPGQICEQPHAGEVCTESSQKSIHIHIQMSQPSNDYFSAIHCLAMSSTRINHISLSTQVKCVDLCDSMSGLACVDWHNTIQSRVDCTDVLAILHLNTFDTGLTTNNTCFKSLSESVEFVSESNQSIYFFSHGPSWPETKSLLGCFLHLYPWRVVSTLLLSARLASLCHSFSTCEVDPWGIQHLVPAALLQRTSKSDYSNRWICWTLFYIGFM